jgi:hypothetical protein
MVYSPRRSRRSEAGFMLMDAIFGIIILAIAMAGIVKITRDKALDSRDDATAAQLREVAKGLSDYIIANRTQILGIINAGGGVPATLVFATLQGQGFLTQGISPQNSYGQTYNLLIAQNPPGSGSLQGLVVLTGGNPMVESRLERTAGKVGGAGGFISSLPMYAGHYQGVNGTWSVPFSVFAPIGIVPQSGHLVASATFGGNVVNQAFLYRYNMGDPLLNTMQSDLNLNGYGVAGAGTINSTTVTTTTLNATSGNFGSVTATTVNGQ